MLTSEQQDLVRTVAARVAAKYKAGRTATMKYHAKTAGIAEVNLHGFGAELAVASLVGGRWNEGDRRKADIDEAVQVRQSRFEDAHLLLYDYDKADHRFVLATGSFPSYVVRGWASGHRGMWAHWRRAKGQLARFRSGGEPIVAEVNLWAVEQRFLWPMEIW